MLLVHQPPGVSPVKSEICLCAQRPGRDGKKQEATPGWEVVDLTSKENLHTRLILDRRKMRKKIFLQQKPVLFFPNKGTEVSMFCKYCLKATFLYTAPSVLLGS